MHSRKTEIPLPTGYHVTVESRLASTDRVRVPILSELVPQGIRPGTIFVVEFDPNSQWLAVATTIAARYLQQMGRVGFVTFTRPPEDVKRDLTTLGVDVAMVGKENRLTVDDWYSATLTGGRLESAGGQGGMVEPIQGGLRARTLKVSDLSVGYLKSQKEGWQPFDIAETWAPGAVIISDCVSEMLRFNEENAVMELFLTRVNPNERKAKRIFLAGLVRGVHTESFYKRFESSADGVIEIRVMEREGEVKNQLRMTSLRGEPHDTHWHDIELKPNGEVRLAGIRP